jgi:hypothetical protein
MELLGPASGAGIEHNPGQHRAMRGADGRSGSVCVAWRPHAIHQHIAVAGKISPFQPRGSQPASSTLHLGSIAAASR